MRDFSELRKIYGDQEGSPWKLSSYEHFVDNNSFISMDTLGDATMLVAANTSETVRIELIAVGYQTEAPNMYGMHNIGGCLLTRRHVESAFDSDDDFTRFTITFNVEEDPHG